MLAVAEWHSPSSHVSLADTHPGAPGRTHVGEAGAIVVGSSFGTGFLGFLRVVPLKALVIKAVLLVLMGPLAVTDGWLVGRARDRPQIMALSAIIDAAPREGVQGRP